MPPELAPGSIVVGYALLMAAASFALVRLALRSPAWVDDVPISDFFELSDAEVNERFNDIVAAYGERLIPHSEDVFDVEEGGL